MNDDICQDSDHDEKWQLDPYNDILSGQLTIKEQGFMYTPTRSHMEYCLTIAKDYWLMGTHWLGTIELKTTDVRFGIYQSCYMNQISITIVIQCCDKVLAPS